MMWRADTLRFLLGLVLLLLSHASRPLFTFSGILLLLSQDGDLVIVDYIGYLSDGRVFDSSTSPGRKPLAIQIGKNTVIPGLEEAVLSMRQGGQRVVIVPPALGYGDRGVCLSEAGGECLVPPNSVIEYDLTLRRVSPSPI